MVVVAILAGIFSLVLAFTPSSVNQTGFIDILKLLVCVLIGSTACATVPPLSTAAVAAARRTAPPARAEPARPRPLNVIPAQPAGYVDRLTDHE